MTDFGDGTAECRYFPSDGASPTTDCKSNPWNQNCSALDGSVQINLVNSHNVTTYTPDVQKWLNNIGLGNVKALSKFLQVFVKQDPPESTRLPVPPLDPSKTTFLSSLERASIVQVVECIDTPTNPCNVTAPVSKPGPVLQGLPGLRNIREVTASATEEKRQIQVDNTAFTNLDSFSGLVCPLDQLFPRGNTNMTSFRGMDNVPLNNGGTFINATGSGPFLTADSLKPLYGLNGCSQALLNPQPTIIPVGCNIQLSTSKQVCDYQASSW